MHKQTSKENYKQMMGVPKHFKIWTSVKNDQVRKDNDEWKILMQSTHINGF